MNRRDFLKGASAASISLSTLAAGASELQAEQATSPVAPSGPSVKCGVIGLGERGRDILHTLTQNNNLTPVAICDIYPPFVKRGQSDVPSAIAYSDYHQLLADKNVEAVFISTPSQLHKQIVLDALQAGKHVYCEAPLANTVDDAKVIAIAGQQAAPKQIFQAGLQKRVHPQYLHVKNFIISGALGVIAASRMQWHKKTSWRKASPDPQQQKMLNWRLYQDTSPGLMGELGIHSLDIASWYLNGLPIAATGYGSIQFWKDDRNVPDTVQAIVEYPNGVRMASDITLVNSFDETYEVFLGSQSAIFTREDKAWMVNEADAPLEGWIVYARKEQVGDDIGIALIADATKLLALGKDPAKDSQKEQTKSMLYYALDAFAESIHTGKPSMAGPLDGYQATVAALKTNEAILTGTRIEFKKEWFTLT